MSLRRMATIVMGLIAVIASLVSIIVTYRIEKRALIDGIDSKLYSTAILAKEILPSDYHDTIQSASSVSEEQYIQIVHRWDRICTDLDLEYIWSLLLIDGKIVFTSGSSKNHDAAAGDYALFFEEHSNPSAYKTAFEKMQPDYLDIEDEWGQMRAVIVPFYDSADRKYLFGASMNLSAITETVRMTILKSIVFGFVTTLVSIVIVIFLVRVITNPIVKICELAGSIAQGKEITYHHDDQSKIKELNLLYRSIEKMNSEIAERVKLLDDSIKEKEVLLREIHHRVKNNMQVISSLLNLQMNKLRDPVLTDMFSVAVSRIQSMASVHEQLYRSDNLSEIRLDRYLESFVPTIEEIVLDSRFQKKISIDFTLSEIFVDIEKAVPIGLITQEIIMNCYKHAFQTQNTGKIEISIIQRDHGTILRIQDDGVGFDMKTAKNKDSLGLKLIDSLVEQIDAEYLLESNSSGTSFFLKFNPG